MTKSLAKVQKRSLSREDKISVGRSSNAKTSYTRQSYQVIPSYLNTNLAGGFGDKRQSVAYYSHQLSSVGSN